MSGVLLNHLGQEVPDPHTAQGTKAVGEEEFEEILDELPELLTSWAERIYQSGGRDALLGDDTIHWMSLQDGKVIIATDAWSGSFLRTCDLATEIEDKIAQVREGIQDREPEDVAECRTIAEQLIALGQRLLREVEVAEGALAPGADKVT